MSADAYASMVRHNVYQLEERGTMEIKVSHYNDVIMGTMASQITSLTIVHSSVDSGANQRKYQSSALMAFVRVIHR